MMWQPVQNLFKTTEPAAKPTMGRVPPVPLRRHVLNFQDIIVGSIVRFANSCELPELQGKTTRVQSIRHYRFGDDEMASFRLIVGQNTYFSFSVVEDTQGPYLAISRQLTSAEQDQWFGRDALSFFTEPSTAKTLRCKADLEIDGAWAADRYVKSVDWVEGHLSDGRQHTQFRYNLLLSESSEKALEVEHYPMIEKNKIYVTVYRPVEDISAILEPSEMVDQAVLKKTPAAKSAPALNGHHHPAEKPAFAPVIPAQFAAAYPSVAQGTSAKPKPDFRRANESAEEEIHIHSTNAMTRDTIEDNSPPLPSFLLSREHNYLSLDAVLQPEAERVRCGLLAAKNIIDAALGRGVRVRDVLRETVGLDSMLADEVVFEMPLSDHDYRVLAQRYRMRPDHREEIRARLQNELRAKLLGLPE